MQAHQRQLLELMGIQTWVQIDTPVQIYQPRTVWRDQDLDTHIKSEIVSLKSPQIPEEIIPPIVTEPVLTAIEKVIQPIDSPLPQVKVDDDVFKQVNQYLNANIEIEPRFLAVAVGQHFAVVAEFDVDIQDSQYLQCDDVKLWHNIGIFLQNTQQLYLNHAMINRIITWNYDFIQIEQESLTNFQQGYLDYLAQQKQIFVLGDTLKYNNAKILPSLSQMLHSAEAKRKCYQALMALFAPL